MLVVVDMQDKFPAALFPKVINGVMREIKKAKRNGEHIVVLEWFRCGPTIKPIKDELKRYKKATWLTKHTDDGSHAIHKNTNINYRTFKVCGVNLDACVEATVSGLSYFYPKAKIELVLSACGSPYLNRPHLRMKMNSLKEIPNVKLVGRTSKESFG